MPSVKLKKGRDKSLLRKHPWVFSGAIDKINNITQNGETVEIISADGKLLGFGSYSAQSQISVRVLSFNPDDEVDPDFFVNRFNNAFQLRNNLIDEESTNAYRLVNAENDFLPGLIVDKYNNYLVCQFLSAGAEFHKKLTVDLLSSLLKPTGIFERSDADVRLKEGLNPAKGVLFGKTPDDLMEITENGRKFLVDIIGGHKTGFYLDQRQNRNFLTQFAGNKKVLNCFSYTGGFSVYALGAEANKVTNVDSSESALALAQKNLNLNGFNSEQFENIRGDVFSYLRKLRDSNQQFDLIILDPPKFAESANQINKASKGYKDINLLALKLLSKNGILFTFSCSGHITTELFNKIIADAANDSDREVHILNYLTQSPDHAVSANFPEGLYLKGLICTVN